MKTRLKPEFQDCPDCVERARKINRRQALGYLAGGGASLAVLAVAGCAPSYNSQFRYPCTFLFDVCSWCCCSPERCGSPVYPPCMFLCVSQCGECAYQCQTVEEYTSGLKRQCYCGNMNTYYAVRCWDHDACAQYA
jgi:hypothetical protein